MTLIGRDVEQKELSEAYQAKKAEFIVIYGRRRVGKTYLIENFFKKQECIFFQAIGLQDGSLKEQLKEFFRAIGEVFYSGASIMPATSWMNAFEELTKTIKKIPDGKTIVLFFDEFPWMASRRSRIVEALDYYWNKHWSKINHLKLVLCGSSASWLIKNIVQNKGGLHNRYTKSMLIRPFSLKETKAFLQAKGCKFNDRQILQLYMVLGGVPYYLEQIKTGKSAAENINHICFNQNGLLFAEFEKLFKSLFENAQSYIELIRIVCESREGVSRSYIDERSTHFTKGGTLSEKLNDLELAGFIKSFLPLDHHRQGLYYRIIDEFVYFYLKWIEPIKHTLITQEPNNEYWLSQIKSQKYVTWMGYTFESVCYKHIAQIRQALHISAGAHVGTWRYTGKKLDENGAQIDLLFDRSDDAITICEIKCTESAFVIDKKYYQELQKKIEVYKKVTRSSKQIFIAFVCASDLKDNSYAKEIVDSVVVLEDLFK